MRTGRPKMDEDERSSEALALRLRKSEMDMIRGQADAWGVTVSACAREILVAWFIGDTPNKKACRGNKAK